MAAGNSGLQSLGVEWVNKSIFPVVPSEFLILFHGLGFSQLHISEPIIITTVMG